MVDVKAGTLGDIASLVPDHLNKVNITTKRVRQIFGFPVHIKIMWHIYTMEYYSAIKRNEIELFAVRWLDLETVIQSEVSQKEKNNTE